MNLAELVNEVRIELGDLGERSITVTDERITQFLNEAEYEACLRGHLILDTTQTISVIADTAAYVLPSSTVTVERVYSPLTTSALTLTDRHELDRTSDWASVKDNPTHYFVDDQLHLYPVPIATDTLQMVIKRTPITPMAADADEPEIPSQYHRYLVDYACFKLTKDKDYYALFEQGFGPRLSGRSLLFNRRQGIQRNKAHF